MPQIAYGQKLDAQMGALGIFRIENTKIETVEQNKVEPHYTDFT